MVTLLCIIAILVAIGIVCMFIACGIGVVLVPLFDLIVFILLIVILCKLCSKKKGE